MDFDTRKIKVLADIASGRDNSYIGSIDKGIIDIVKMLNNHPDFYTTSSCAGRLLLQTRPFSGKKKESKRIFVNHGPISTSHFYKATEFLPNDNIWFYMESFILHICTRDILAAFSLIKLSAKCGLKHSGLISASHNKYIVEIIGNEHMELLVARNGKLILPNQYIEIMLKEAEKKLKRNGELKSQFLSILSQL